MSNRPWKSEERRAAALFGGTRFPANTGGVADFETDGVVGQVKHVRQLSLAALEALALEMEKVGCQRGRSGVVVVKRRAGRGKKTSRLVVVTESVWRTIGAALAGAPPRPCLWCGEGFTPNAWRSVFCSARCRAEADLAAETRPLIGSAAGAEIAERSEISGPKSPARVSGTSEETGEGR